MHRSLDVKGRYLDGTVYYVTQGFADAIFRLALFQLFRLFRWSKPSNSPSVVRCGLNSDLEDRGISFFFQEYGFIFSAPRLCLQRLDHPEKELFCQDQKKQRLTHTSWRWIQEYRYSVSSIALQKRLVFFFFWNRQIFHCFLSGFPGPRLIHPGSSFSPAYFFSKKSDLKGIISDFLQGWYLN